MLKKDKKWLEILKTWLPITWNRELGGLTVKGQVENGLCIIGTFAEPEQTGQDPSLSIYTGVSFKDIAVQEGWLDELKNYVKNDKKLALRNFGEEAVNLIETATNNPETYYPMFNSDIKYQATTGNIELSEQEIADINENLMENDTLWEEINSSIQSEIEELMKDREI